MIDKSFVDALSAIAVKAAGTAQVVTHPPQEPENVYYLDGKKCVADPIICKSAARDLSAIVAHAEEFNDSSEVWYDRKFVICIFDRSDFLERITLPLVWSPQMKRLMEMDEDKDEINQRDLILLLRTLFKNNLDSNLISIIRAMRFTTAVDNASEIQHGRTSLGKKIESAATGQDKIPESFTLRVTVWDNANFPKKYPVEVCLDMDAQTETFTLIPVPGDIEKAMVMAEMDLREALGAALPDYQHIYYGSP